MDRPMLFGKYCLLERISVGGMAEVFRAKPLPAEETGKMLALKRILPHLAEDEDFITMFVDEAKLTVQLKHPNIVETYELGNFQESYYIVMEYIAGADVLTLQKRLRKRRRIMSVAQACYVAREVAKGLHYAHNKCDDQGRPFNIIHRDVSPQNIRLTYDGRVKLIDFGIAKAAVQRTKTQVGVLKGKFGYMSPEQVHGEEIDHRSDVFALGTCLWEMLTNRRLFNGENEFETLQMVKQCNIPPPSEKNGQVPPEVDDIVMTALEPDRDRRYGSAKALQEVLTGFLEGIDQPYTSRHLKQWMADTFSEELGEERRKRRIYNKIETPTDVKHFEELLPEDEETEDLIDDEERETDQSAAAGVSVPEDEVAEEQRDDDADLWDPDFAPDEEDVDPEEFASNHTRVAAGGFDPSVFEDEDDEIMEIDDDDLIEIEDDEFSEAELEGGAVEPADAPAPSASNPSPGRDSAPDPSASEGRPRAPSGSQPDRPEPNAPGGGRGGPDAPEPAPADESGGQSRRRASTEAARTAHPSDGGTDPSARRPEPEEESSSSTLDRFLRAGAAAIAVLAFFGLAGLVGYTINQQRAASTPGTLVIEAHPNLPNGGEFLVDDTKRGTKSPVYVPGLAPGEQHTVEVKHPAYADARRRVSIQPGELRTITVEMETDPSAKGGLRVHFEEQPDDTDVYVDGQPVELERLRERLPLEPGSHLVEVAAPGHKLWSRVVDVEPGDTLVEHVRLRPIGIELRVIAPEASRVEVDGETVGEGTVRVDGLDPRELHDIRVESADGGDVWTSTLGYPRVADGVLKVDFATTPESRAEEDFGWLTAATGDDWWELYVGGAGTDLRTPVDEANRVPVSEGTHTIMFRRGRQMKEVDVDVEAGETTSVDESFAFEWKAQLKQ